MSYTACHTYNIIQITISNFIIIFNHYVTSIIILLGSQIENTHKKTPTQEITTKSTCIFMQNKPLLHNCLNPKHLLYV